MPEDATFTWSAADFAEVARLRGDLAGAGPSTSSGTELRAGTETGAGTGTGSGTELRSGTAEVTLAEERPKSPRFLGAAFLASEAIESFELSSFTIAGVLPGRMGDRAAHRVLSRALFAIAWVRTISNLHSADALLILHVCDPYQLVLANIAHVFAFLDGTRYPTLGLLPGGPDVPDLENEPSRACPVKPSLAPSRARPG